MFLSVAVTFLLLSATMAADVHAQSSICGGGGISMYVCPVSAPVCCFQPVTGIYSACCPLNTVCDLGVGACLVYPNSSASTPRPNNNRSGSNGTEVTSAAPVPLRVVGGLQISSGSAAVAIAGVAVVMIIGAAASVWLGSRCAAMYELRLTRLRLAALREARAVDAASDSVSSDGQKSNDSDDDATTNRSQSGQADEIPEEAQCLLCCDAKKDAVLIPCAHMMTCYPCAMQLKATKGVCCLCRTKIECVISVRKHRKHRNTSLLVATAITSTTTATSA